jgi:hypothetical protein
MCVSQQCALARSCSGSIALHSTVCHTQPPSRPLVLNTAPPTHGRVFHKTAPNRKFKVFIFKRDYYETNGVTEPVGECHCATERCLVMLVRSFVRFLFPPSMLPSPLSSRNDLLGRELRKRCTVTWTVYESLSVRETVSTHGGMYLTLCGRWCHCNQSRGRLRRQVCLCPVECDSQPHAGRSGPRDGSTVYNCSPPRNKVDVCSCQRCSRYIPHPWPPGIHCRSGSLSLETLVQSIFSDLHVLTCDPTFQEHR